VPADQRLDVDRLATALQAQGIDAAGASDVDALVADVAHQARPGDVVLVMSNGAFGGFVAKLLAARG
jgi:UDP-N-acetylmuramate: L-alanyl-gamma-D-glutamyl-meso-diaminopimelate ligase